MINKLEDNAKSIIFNESDGMIWVKGIWINSNNIEHVLDKLYNKNQNIEEIFFEWNRELNLLSDNINKFWKLKKISFVDTGISFDNLNKITNKSSIVFEMETGSYTYRQNNEKEWFYVWGSPSRSKWFKYQVFHKDWEKIEEFGFWRFIKNRKSFCKINFKKILKPMHITKSLFK